MTIAGRKPILSQLKEGAAPDLTPLGRIAAAALRALHLVKAAVGVADYVIMPDHVHFLMVVNYDKDPQISPVYLAKRLMEVIEMAAANRGKPNGPEAPPLEPSPELLATYLREAIRLTDIEYCYGPEALRGLGAEPSVLSAHAREYFDRFVWVELSYSSLQLKCIREYIKLNPARYFWKRNHPDKFAVHRGLQTAAIKRACAKLPYGGKLRFDGVGELSLLASPFLFHVRLTLKKSVQEHAAAIAEIVERAKRGQVPVSGFISPGEKEALRRLKAEPRARFIRLLPAEMPPRYDPSAEDSRELAAGRMAIISAFPDAGKISAVAMRQDSALAHTFRAQCLRMNDMAAALCDFAA